MIKKLFLLFALLVHFSLLSGTLLVPKSAAIALAQNQGGITVPNQQTGNQPQTSLINGLNPFRNLNVTGDYVAAGVGLRDQTQGNIIISAIPAGASVVEAYLYWGMLDTGESPSLKNLNFNGTPITGTLVGSDRDTCWGRANSFAYRANVTSLVPGNGVYALTNVASGGLILAQGASLIVIYQRAGELNRDVVLLDGDVVLDSIGTFADTVISGFLAVAPISAKTTFVVGDGQPFAAETLSFTGGAGTAFFFDSLEGSDGPLWDTDTFIVSSQINPGDTTATARISIGFDCLMWVAQAFSVTANQPFDICLQNDGNGGIFRLNSTTGEYQFTNCSGLNTGGTGSLVTRGSLITFQHNAPDRRVLVRIDRSAKTGTASVQLFSQGRTYTIMDRNITDNSCSCGN